MYKHVVDVMGVNQQMALPYSIVWQNINYDKIRCGNIIDSSLNKKSKFFIAYQLMKKVIFLVHLTNCKLTANVFLPCNRAWGSLYIYILSQHIEKVYECCFNSKILQYVFI